MIFDAAPDWLRPVLEHAPLRAVGELALGAIFGTTSTGVSPPLPPAAPAPVRAAAPLTPDDAALIQRALAVNANALQLPVPGPPPAGPNPKDMLRTALTNFLQGSDVRGVRVAALVAERCIQEAYDLAVVMAEDLETSAKANGGRAKVAAMAWADAGAIAYLNHPKIALARFQKAREIGAEDVVTRLWLGTLYYRLGRIGEAEACYRAAEQVVSPNDSEMRAAVLCNVGCVAVTRADYAAADENFQSALRLVEAIGNKAQQSAMIGNSGLVAYTRGDLVSAGDLCRRALVLAEEAGDLERAALQYGNLGVVAHDRGDDKLARDYYKQALDLYKEMGQEEHPGARNVLAHLRSLDGYTPLPRG